MSVNLLDLLDSIRERLDDVADDADLAPEGYVYYWQYDDSTRLWKNTELIRYLKRALRDVAARAPIQEEGITADVLGVQCRLSVTANTAQVTIPSHILSIERVRLVSSGMPLTKTTSAALSADFGSDDWTTDTGTPTHYLEPRAGYLRLYPIPESSDEIRLIVRRGFDETFTWADIAGPEVADNPGTPLVDETYDPSAVTLSDVPVEWEEALICAVCRLAYLKRDADTYSLPMSQEFERQLAILVGPPVNLRQRQARRENANLSVAIRGFGYTRQRVGLTSEEEDE